MSPRRRRTPFHPSRWRYALGVAVILAALFFFALLVWEGFKGALEAGDEASPPREGRTAPGAYWPAFLTSARDIEDGARRVRRRCGTVRVTGARAPAYSVNSIRPSGSM